MVCEGAIEVLRDWHVLVRRPDDLADGRELDWIGLSQNPPDFALVVAILLDHLACDKHAPLCDQLLRQLANLACLINLDGL